jgi:hypothetical protein
MGDKNVLVFEFKTIVLFDNHEYKNKIIMGYDFYTPVKGVC